MDDGDRITPGAPPAETSSYAGESPTRAAFHFKQAGSVLASEWGMSDRKGGALDELPSDLRIREYPNG